MRGPAARATRRRLLSSATTAIVLLAASIQPWDTGGITHAVIASAALVATGLVSYIALSLVLQGEAFSDLPVTSTVLWASAAVSGLAYLTDGPRSLALASGLAVLVAVSPPLRAARLPAERYEPSAAGGWDGRLQFLTLGSGDTEVIVSETRPVPLEQHVLVGGKTFHDREEVETIRAALAAIEWPDDELSVFAALRGALFAIGDEELFEYRGQDADTATDVPNTTGGFKHLAVQTDDVGAPPGELDSKD
mgnify:CR=1 FL=1